jgi:hypothetical protein
LRVLQVDCYTCLYCGLPAVLVKAVRFLIATLMPRRLRRWRGGPSTCSMRHK